MKIIFKVLLLSCIATFSCNAQILEQIKKAKNKIIENTVDVLSRDPITTSFKDVDKTKHFENSFGDDATYASFFSQPFDETEGFTLQPGFYEGDFQSFCIKAGTYHPTKGRGRFYAPIKGPKADIVSNIIEEYQRRSDITQREVQLLLWAIIAKTDFYKMTGPVKETATKLLTPAQIARLSKGALDKLTRNELKSIANKSGALRAVLEAENNLRLKYYAGVKSYQEYEEIAMLAGVEPIVAGFEAGRWTQHPDGYFLRYFPSGYSRTKTQVYIPGSIGTIRYNPTNSIAVPPNSGQRLLQTSLPSGNTVGYVKPYQDPFCEPVFNAAADKAIREQMIMQNIPGLAVAVYKNGKMVHLNAYGYENIYEQTPITLDTKMKWASISKSVTGVAAAQLDERRIGNFKITNKITDYVENWKSVRYTDTTGKKTGTDKRPLDITLNHLLTNSSGIQQYGKGSRPKDNQYYTLFVKNKDTAVVKFVEQRGAYGENDPTDRKFKANKAVDVFNGSVLDFEPGSKYFYSSYGFVLAGAAIDKAAPEGYISWVEKNIKNVAGLHSMQVCEEGKPGHDMSEDGMLRAYNSGNLERTIPAGGYESNICDLAKYAYALSTGKFFQNKKDILWNNTNSFVTPSGSKYNYGLHSKGSGADLRVWHGGHGGNVRSHFMFFPSDSTGIALIAPAVYADLPALSKYIFEAMNIRPSLYSGNINTPMDKCRSDMGNGDDVFHGLWRKTGDDVLVRTGFEKSGFFKEMDYLKDNGYEVVDIETFRNDGKRYWDAVLKKGIADSKLVSDLSLSDLKSKIQKMKNDGYIVIDVESYIAGNSGRLWGAVFSKQNKAYSVSFKMRPQDLLDNHQANVNKGLKLVDIDVYKADDIQQWTGVWVSGGESLLKLNMEPIEFFALVKDKRKQGYRLTDIEYTMVDNQQWRVSAVWEKASGDEFITGELYDSDGDGVDDDGDRLVFQLFCEQMDMHHNKMKHYELIDWERIDIEWFED